MHIDKYKQPDGSYLDPENCWWDDAESFLQGCTLGFCCCGSPTESLTYVRDVLQHIDNLKRVHAKEMTWEAWDVIGLKLAGSTGALYFAYYVMSQKELTEHGGSVPGWLTDKGIEFLEDLNAYLSENESAPSDQPKIPGKFLSENPTPFDYLHAIRAVASRCGNTQIFDLADAGMNETSGATEPKR